MYSRTTLLVDHKVFSTTQPISLLYQHLMTNSNMSSDMKETLESIKHLQEYVQEKV